MSLFLGRVERRAAAQTFPVPPIPPVRGGDPYGNGRVLNAEAAMTVPTVWACVGLLANAVSMLPLEVVRSTADGVPQRLPTPPLLARPYADMTQSEWLHMLMVSLLLRGNAYGHIISRDTAAYPTQIALLNPDKVQVRVADDGRRSYIVVQGGKERDITGDVWHVRGMTMPGSIVGLSPVAYAAAVIGIDLSSRTFAGDFYAGGGIPKAVIKTDQAVNQEQARTIKERLLMASANREPVVLGQGLDYQPISVRPDESQFLATQQANVAQIARYFHVPPEMVGGSAGNSLTYANVEQRQLDFLTLSVSFWLKRIEDAMFPLLPRPQQVVFRTQALLRTDAETQAKVDNQRLAGRLVTPTELRQRDGLPPMTDEQKAEVDLVPMTITPLGSVKALPGLKTGPGAPAPVPPGDQQGVLNGAA